MKHQMNWPYFQNYVKITIFYPEDIASLFQVQEKMWRAQEFKMFFC